MPAPEFLVLSSTTWDATASVFESYARARLEAGLLWYGTRSADAAAVALVGVPRQQNRGRSFDITSDELARLNQSVPDGLVVVAQVHTHPGDDTAHSPWDDGRVVSRKILSLVLPRHGSEPALAEAAVHEFVDGQWVRLSTADARRRIVMVASIADARR